MRRYESLPLSSNIIFIRAARIVTACRCSPVFSYNFNQFPFSMTVGHLKTTSSSQHSHDNTHKKNRHPFPKLDSNRGPPYSRGQTRCETPTARPKSRWKLNPSYNPFWTVHSVVKILSAFTELECSCPRSQKPTIKFYLQSYPIHMFRDFFIHEQLHSTLSLPKSYLPHFITITYYLFVFLVCAACQHQIIRLNLVNITINNRNC